MMTKQFATKDHGDEMRSGSTMSWAWLAVAAIVIATFYPGIMSKDSLAALNQARTLQFNDWHPPILALIWSVLDKIVAGSGLMLVAQAVLYSVSAAKLCAEAFPHLNARWHAWLVVPTFALFPPAMTLTGMIWKDVWMSGLLLLAMAYLFRLSKAGNRAVRIRAFSVIVVCCLLATAFRHNALAATAGLLAGACFFVRPTWGRQWVRAVAASVGGLLLSVLLFTIVSATYRAIATRSNIATAILLHDIGGMIVRSTEPELAARLALAVSPILTDDREKFVQRLRQSYPYNMVRTSRRPNAPFTVNVFDPRHDAAAVERAWRTMLHHYPGAYLKHRTAAFACLLQLCDRDKWAFHSYILNKDYAFPDSVDGSSWQARLRRVFLSPALVILYAPVLWLFVAGAGGILGLRRLGTSGAILLFMSLSAVGLATSMFFTTPIESYRYVHWVTLVGWTMLWMLADSMTARRRLR